MVIGNDVMDLAHHACRARLPGDRLLARILDHSERAWLEAERPSGPWHVPLWALWAAKEAAYKASSKAAGPSGPVFSPRSLVCQLEIHPVGPPGGRSDDAVSIRGTVRGHSLTHPVAVRGTSDGEHLHVIGWTDAGPPGAGRFEAGVQRLPDDRSLEGLRDRFTDAEWAGIHSAESAIVRFEARERLRAMMGRMGIGEPEPGTIEILTSPGPLGTGRRGQTPPSVHVDGRAVTGWDVSLSHHGRYVAWAVTGSGGS